MVPFFVISKLNIQMISLFYDLSNLFIQFVPLKNRFSKSFMKALSTLRLPTNMTYSQTITTPVKK